VADALRARVLAAVAELKYVPNAHAQMLARSHRSAVGVIVHDVSDPYFAEITRGLQRVATADGRLVIICNSFREPDRELEYIDLLHAHQVAAIVIAGSGYLDATTAARLTQNVPMDLAATGELSRAVDVRCGTHVVRATICLRRCAVGLHSLACGEPLE